VVTITLALTVQDPRPEILYCMICEDNGHAGKSGFWVLGHNGMPDFGFRNASTRVFSKWFLSFRTTVTINIAILYRTIIDGNCWVKTVPI
jgi:hypothetical protein